MNQQYKKRKSISFKGTILMDLTYRAGSLNKKSFVKFSLAEIGGRKIYAARAFDLVADELSLLLPSDEIVVSGYLNDMDELIINSFIKGSGSPLIKEITNKLSSEREKEVLRTEAEQMALSGYVRVSRREETGSIHYWEKKEYCIETEVGWVSMIEFLMDSLTPEVVAAKLRERLGLTVDKALKVAVNPDSYKQWLRDEVNKVIKGDEGVIRV